MPEIKLEHVTKRWAKFYAVEDLNLTIENNAFVTLLGPSGCGKTTTLRMIAGLETPTSGRITIGDKVVFDSDLGINVPANKRKVGFLFQNYALWPNMTVYQNISFGLSNVKEALPKIDFDAKNAARLAEILKTPADVVSVLDECRDKDGKLEEKKAILKLIDAFTLSQYTAKKLFDYHLEAKTDCASEIAALTAKVETAKKAAQDAGCTLDDEFRYTKDGKDVLRNVSFTMEEGEILTIIGGNGAGKSTLLQILAHQRTPYKGKLFVDGKRVTRSKQKEGQTLHLLPQDPLLLFLDNTVISDYEAHCKRSGMTTEQAAERIDDIVSLLCIEPLLRRHPADLSGGERQRVALGKLLLDRPTILLLDEPTKGLDPMAKAALQQVLRQLQRQGITLCIVTHDLHFAASVSDRCALFFDGEVLPPKQPQDFFRNNHFYTTAANQLAKPFEPSIILTEQFLHSIQQGDSDDEQQ